MRENEFAEFAVANDVEFELVGARTFEDVHQKLIEGKVIEALKQVYDPEIPVNIYELGLIYAIEIAPSGDVKVEMTLTAPGCPSAQELPEMVRTAIAELDGVGNVTVETVWDPPWDPRKRRVAAADRA